MSRCCREKPENTLKIHGLTDGSDYFYSFSARYVVQEEAVVLSRAGEHFELAGHSRATARLVRRAERAAVPFRRALFLVSAFLSILSLPARGSECVRMPVDSVGYAILPGQMDEVIRKSEKVIRERGGMPTTPGSSLIGGICPHDDYIYAGPAYVKLMKHVDVPLVVLIGVSHGARRAGIQGKLVFDDYTAWKGPYGEIPVSPVRNALLDFLPEEIILVSNELHGREHSLEGLLPFLQYPGFSCHADGDRKGFVPVFEILPVLITFFSGDSIDSVVGIFARSLHNELKKRNMKLGRDYVVLISADCVHYGDEKWGGRNHAPFGTTKDGYEKAVARDIDIVRTALTGKMDDEHVCIFRKRVDSFEFEWPYRIPWCGVYSIPFGIKLLLRLSEMEGRGAPVGKELDYSTSLDPGALEFDVPGMGATNIATLRHWVGYTSVGYW